MTDEILMAMLEAEDWCEACGHSDRDECPHLHCAHCGDLFHNDKLTIGADWLDMADAPYCLPCFDELEHEYHKGKS